MDLYDIALTREPPTVWKVRAKRAIPHRCPVCEGRGNVPDGFYGRLGASNAVNAESCRACEGSGILWS